MILRRVLPPLLSCILLAPDARADPPASSVPRSMQACLDAADRAQLARDERRLIAARQELLVCSSSTCPLLLRKDCAKWLDELAVRLPQVVVSARDENDHDIVDVRVSVDGKLLTEKLDGRLLPVDPGEHLFRYEPVGRPPQEERILVREGETNRLLTVKLRAYVAEAPPEPPRASAGNDGRPVPALSYVLAGTAVLGGAAFAFFAGNAKSDLQHLRDTCGRDRSCADSDVDGVRQKLLVANVALGVGIVALAGAAWFFFTRGDAR